MKTTRIARRLGLDGNPLRRRTDKIAARLLLAVFLMGAPFLSVAAVAWASHNGTAELRVMRSWQQVSAVLLRTPPTPGATSGVLGYHQVMARWTAPDGRRRTGWIPVSGEMGAGRTVRLWVDAAGSPTGIPLKRDAVLSYEAIAAVVATVALGIVLLCLARTRRWALDRRRLADWEAGWAAVGPQWTRRFRSRG
jgi:hypothetical protein